MSGPAVVSVSSSWIQEQFRCCICLDVFRDPVCTPCGHNFCLDCIEGFWETKARPECPLCKEVFSCRPELRVNHSFADIIQHLLRNLPNPEVQRADSPDPCSPDPCSPDPCSPDPSPRRPLEDLLCDVCSEAQAVRSCLVCQTSYCQLHVAPHLCDSVLRRHSLTDPASFPSPHLCRRHQRPLLLYCQKERTAVCESCGHREHKQHRTISVERATRRVKAAVKETKADLQRMIQDRVGKAEQIQQNLDQSKKQTHQEVERSVRRWSLLLCALEQEQRSLVEELQSRQKEVEEEAQQLLSQLQQEVKELQARGADILELESTRHSLHLIQSFPLLSKLPQTRDWDELRVCSDRGLGPVREALSNMRDLCHNLCSEVSAEEVDSLAEHAVDVTFDPDTASGWVEVSADGKKVNVRAQKKKMVVTDSARRFDCCVCVLGREQFTSGRRYWVVESALTWSQAVTGPPVKMKTTAVTKSIPHTNRARAPLQRLTVANHGKHSSSSALRQSTIQRTARAPTCTAIL
uniref:Uncharacterized protein n=1 Tax=Knipowitschia caucasica TaxID=637954 RepID=A0AAV2KIN0_KNICA